MNPSATRAQAPLYPQVDANIPTQCEEAVAGTLNRAAEASTSYGLCQFLTLPLPHSGKLVMIDPDDHRAFGNSRWSLSVHGYAYRQRKSAINPCGREIVFLHREIMGLTRDDKCDVDHINGNKLDNRRCNLRLATRAQNKHNEGRRKNNKSGYKGVFWHGLGKKWGTSIRIPGRRIHLGLFDTPEEAHEVYCLAADMLHEEFANHGLRK